MIILRGDAPRHQGAAVHLLLGHSQDPCCLSVQAELEAGGYPTRIISQPMMLPSSFAWRLDNGRSASRLILDDELQLRDDQIAGVFVRSTGWIDSDGWQPDDLAYMQAETQAALLAWLWSLACPVVNRFPPAIWYRPQAPLLSWHALLRRCGLPTLETLVTNVDQEARAFGGRSSLAGVEGAVYGPLTSDLRYLVTGDEDWNGLAALARRAPVCLTYPHAAAQLACVVGNEVIWDGQPPRAAAQLETGLRRFATEAGLAFVEVAFARNSNGIGVVAVESRPYVEQFGELAQQGIVHGIAHLLMDEAGRSRGIPPEPRQILQ